VKKTVKTRMLPVVLAMLSAFVTGFPATASAQKTRTAAVAKTAPGLLSSLPQSDAMALIDQRQLLDQVVPKILADNPAKLAEVNAEIENFKTQTGVDSRSFDQVALSLRYKYPSAGVTKVDTVALAHGTFNAAAFVAAGKTAAAGKYHEEKYEGHTIYIFSLDRQLKVFGLLNLQLGDLAVTPLSANVLAIGSAETVRTAIDASKGRGGLNADLIGLATRDPKAIIGFGGNISARLLENLKISNEEVTKDLATVRQVYGSVGLSEKNLEMFLAARTTNANSARNLSDTLEGLKQIGGLVVGRLPGAKGAVAQTALGNLKITTQDNELQIRTTVAQAEIAPLLIGGR
jgi:hypothetical protein